MKFRFVGFIYNIAQISGNNKNYVNEFRFCLSKNPVSSRGTFFVSIQTTVLSRLICKIQLSLCLFKNKIHPTL